jgi:hypothetical protein
MKISIAASILILLVAALFGVQNQQRLTTLRTSHAKLVVAAAQLGISVDLTHAADPVRITKRERENKDADAKLAAAEFIAFAKEMEAIEKKGGQPDEAQKKRSMAIIDRMMSLDPAQLKSLVAEIRATKDLKDETRQGIIGFSIMTLSNDHPQAALALFTESSDLFKENGMGTDVVSSSLAMWAKDDPMAALEWMKTNSAKFPDLITDDTKRGLIAGTAIQDPKLAFKLIIELGIKEASRSIASIIRSAKTLDERTATFNALREHLATLPDENARTEAADNGVRNFASNLVEGGFEANTQWLAAANFTPAELESFASGLYGSIKGDENGKWIEWLGEKLPANKAAENIENLVRNWTRNDYQAAGKWLSTSTEGPTKNTAIRSYAQTVAEYEPASAAQWAMTLPPGKDRDETLKYIYQNWPENDSTARAAFKQEHGIE